MVSKNNTPVTVYYKLPRYAFYKEKEEYTREINDVEFLKDQMYRILPRIYVDRLFLRLELDHSVASNLNTL